MSVNRQRGAVLGIVMVLIVVVLASSVLALWTLRGETNAAGTDRLGRQLFDCAEQGLAFGKQWFSSPAQRASWDQFLSTDVCALSENGLPCPLFPSGGTATPPPGYPNGAPYVNTVTVGDGPSTLHLVYQVAIYNNAENTVPAPKCQQTPPDPRCLFHDGDNQVMIYASCREPISGQSRQVQALISALTADDGCGYQGQAGFGCRNQGNLN